LDAGAWQLDGDRVTLGGCLDAHLSIPVPTLRAARAIGVIGVVGGYVDHRHTDLALRIVTVSDAAAIGIALDTVSEVCIIVLVRSALVIRIAIAGWYATVHTVVVRKCSNTWCLSRRAVSGGIRGARVRVKHCRCCVGRAIPIGASRCIGDTYSGIIHVIPGLARTLPRSVIRIALSEVICMVPRLAWISSVRWFTVACKRVVIGRRVVRCGCYSRGSCLVRRWCTGGGIVGAVAAIRSWVGNTTTQSA
jgi:hypothetical protein